MKHVTLKALLSTVLISNAAYAAEPFDWTGFYLGANVGYGWAESDPTVRDFNDHFSYYDKTSSEMNGVAGGVQLGYNYQINRIIMGVEADFSGANITNEDTELNTTENATRENNEIDSFGTVRARFGFLPSERLLLYITAGFAFANLDYELQTDTRFHAPYNYQETKTGWAGGAGVEYGISESVTLRAEFLHLDVGDDYDTYAVDGYNVEYGWDTSINEARVGINYLF